MKYYGKITDPKDLTTKEFVDNTLTASLGYTNKKSALTLQEAKDYTDQYGGKVNSISINGGEFIYPENKNINIPLAKNDVGLNNVDNTSDLNKPISNLTQAALDEKVNQTRKINTYPLSADITLTKTDVGLGNVDNISDLNKPISTATQTALDLKANTSDVNAALELKADKTSVSAALELKANKTLLDDVLNTSTAYADELRTKAIEASIDYTEYAITLDDLTTFEKYRLCVNNGILGIRKIVELSSIAVTTPPTKTTYMTGETLDLSGMVVTATYSDNSTKDVTSTCTYSPANGTTLTTSHTAVMVSLGEEIVAQAISVLPYNYFYITAVETSSVEIKQYASTSSYTACSFQKSSDGINWVDYSVVPGVSNPFTLNSGEKIYFRGNNLTLYHYSYPVYFSITGGVDIGGNILSLLSHDLTRTMIDGAFAGVFMNCAIVNAKDLILPSYAATSCYQNLFRNCSKLISVPKLPAMTLYPMSYVDMFNSCTLLTQVPALPATTLDSGCYDRMFANCTSLQVHEGMVAEAASIWKIPTSGSVISTGSSTGYDCATNMFQSCPGSRPVGTDSPTFTVGTQYTYYTQNAPIS